MSERATCRECGAVLSQYRANGEPDDLCAPCAAGAPGEASQLVAGDTLDPERLVLAVAGVLTLSAALRPEDRVHIQAELDRLGISADHVDTHKAIAKLRRRYGWRVFAVEGQAGYRLIRWPFRFSRRGRCGQLQIF